MSEDNRASASSTPTGDELGWSDPARTPPPPAHAIGFPSRTPDFDVLPGFVQPPPGYGEVSFYWWLGDPLTRERLRWQIDQLSGNAISGLQINYAHADSGGATYGLTYPSDPPLFSEEWWKLVDWFMSAAQREGMAMSLSDYTLAPPGQGWYTDEIIAARPDLCGSVLRCRVQDVPVGGVVSLDVPRECLFLAACRASDAAIDLASAVDLRGRAVNGKLAWEAPEGRWKAIAVWPEQRKPSIDPMHPEVGQQVIEHFFGRFEQRFPGQCGKGLNFFFSDELQFNVSGKLWNARLAEEFRRRKGYDLIPELPSLFVDAGPKTQKVRLDYNDVVVRLQEEGYFRPVFEWHQRRGMIYGCDHGGRGRRVEEFGDYFRTQRWNQGPGADQPHFGKDLIKAKVAASIAHLYQRPRVWLEGFYGSGWDTTTAELTDATFANFAMGFNLLTLHGLYYSTHGGFWEWAPPCNHFRMPYWPHMRSFLDCTQRLSYLLSQGVHCCDVAVLYPVAAVEGGLDGEGSVKTAFETGSALYRSGIDFDFMDFESLERAEIAGGEVRVSGERYRVLVIPSMRTVRHSTMAQARRFHRAGGVVVAVGALPEASERSGRGDVELAAMVREVFGEGRTTPSEQVNVAGGKGIHAATTEEARDFISDAVPRDFAFSAPGNPAAFFQHRRIGPREVYFVYGLPRGTECTFAADGEVQRWDPWTGKTAPLPVIEQAGGRTRLRLPLTEREAQIIVFSPGVAERETPRPPIKPDVLPLDGAWDFEVVPVLDNRFGDYHWPPTNELLSPEIRQLRHRDDPTGREDFSASDVDDSSWPKVTQSFGPRLWKLGPLPEDVDVSELTRRLSSLEHIDPAVEITLAGTRYAWQPYAFSWRWGLEGDPGHQGYHGLKCEVTDDFIALGKVELVKHSSTYTREASGGRYLLWTSVWSDRDGEAHLVVGGVGADAVWLSHERVEASTGPVRLRAGHNPLLVQFDKPGRRHVVIGSARTASTPPLPVGAMTMRWRDAPDIFPFDLAPEIDHPVGWYRFRSPPGLRAMTLTVVGVPRLWIDGAEVTLPGPTRVEGSAHRYPVRMPRPLAEPASVAIRVEHARGSYGGAAFPEPIRFECGPGRFPAGDWSANDGLLCFSGGARYRRSIELTAEQAAGSVTLDLGNVVSSAEVRVNGTSAGVRVAPPWRFDLGGRVRAGANRIEVLVYGTLGNHYTTIPSRYKGKPTAGLLGPVQVEIGGG